MAERVPERIFIVGRHVWVGLSRSGEQNLLETYRRGRDRLDEAARSQGGSALGVAIATLTPSELALTALLSH